MISLYFLHRNRWSICTLFCAFYWKVYFPARGSRICPYTGKVRQTVFRFYFFPFQSRLSLFIFKITIGKNSNKKTPPSESPYWFDLI